MFQKVFITLEKCVNRRNFKKCVSPKSAANKKVSILCGEAFPRCAAPRRNPRLQAKPVNGIVSP